MKKNASKLLFIILLSAVLLGVLQIFATNGLTLLAKNPRAMDFLAFYTGATLIASDPHHLYSLPVQINIQQQIVPIIKQLHIFLPFLNPPFIALLFSPLAQLPLMAAYVIWLFINLILLVVICYVAIKQLPQIKRFEKAMLCFSIITYIPILTSLLLGQLSILMSVIFLFSWKFARENKNKKSGLILSLVLMKPHFVVLPLLAFIVQRRGNVLLSFLCGLILIIVLPIVIIGTNEIWNYISLLITAFSWHSGYGIDLRAQHSLQTALLFITNNQNPDAIRLEWYVCIGLILLPTLYVWSKKYKTNTAFFSLQWVLLILADLLISPHTHFHDLALLPVVGIIIIFILHHYKVRQQQTYYLFLLTGYVIALAGYLAGLYIEPSVQSGWIIIDVVYLLVFWGFILFQMLQSNKKKDLILK